MFLGTSFMAATMGATALAAHMIVLSASSISFVVAFAISQAVNVRVASALGAGRPADARRAGFVAIGLGAAVMAVSGCTMFFVPHMIVGVYLDVSAPGAAATAALAVRLLHIAALFQVADGIQTVSAGALRGMHDTRVPMVLAAFAYWLVGLPLAWFFGFWLGWGAVGLWWGMLAGLVCVAACLAGRFVVKTGGWKPDMGST
jgi:MATE family multidrug resistance protein